MSRFIGSPGFEKIAGKEKKTAEMKRKSPSASGDD
jgi:hypothetical protein